MSNAITVVRGDTLDLTVTVTLQSTGAVYDLTNYSAKLTVKKSANLPDTSALISVDGTLAGDPTTGIVTFSLSHLNTDKTPGSYFYDIQILNTITSKVQTVVIDRFKIIEDITRTSISAT